MPKLVTRELLQSFLDAFNRHDLDAIMECFADECVLDMPRGARPRGDRYVGKDAVRAGLATRWAGTAVAGPALEVRGVDWRELAAQGRVCGLNPSAETFETLKPRLAEAFELAVHRQAKRAVRG